jgi:hypothetical protein
VAIFTHKMGLMRWVEALLGKRKGTAHAALLSDVSTECVVTTHLNALHCRHS